MIIFNQSESNSIKIYSLTYLVDLETNGNLNKGVIDWKAKSISKICIVVNVGLDVLGNTFIANFIAINTFNSKQRGNHWICFVIDITKTKIYYYDSLD